MAGNTVKDMTTNFGKLDKFEGHDFRRWQKKMHFLMTTLKVVYVLTTPMLELLENATVEAIRIRAKWENDDYICRGHILNGMYDSLFDVYTNVQSAKELWDSLESKYMAEDSSSKKFLGKEVGGPSVNMTEEGGKNKQNKGKKRSNENNSGSSSNKKPKLKCWKYGKTGQFKKDCQSGKKNNANAGGSGKGSKDHSQDQLDRLWCYNSFFKDRCWFKTYEPVEDGSVLYMGDDHFAPVHGKGSVALEFSSEKTITLFNVLYVPKLRKNLVSGHMLNKCGYKQVCESAPDDLDSVYMSSSTAVNSSLWHARLGHVHYKRMLEISKDDLILAIDENPEKCTTCCRAVVRLPDPKRKTLGEKGIDSIFVGYVEHSKAYSIDDEIGSIIENNTWVLSDLPPGCKWIFKRKMKVDGSIDKFKSRLVIQGFRQKEGINYFDTYAPVARITTIRLLLALAAIHNLVIHQMDVKTTFLNGDLDEEVYMKQPEGFVMSGNEHKASKKQTCITGSTMESEIVALAAACKEAEWLRNLIHEIPIWPKPIAPISIRCDSALTMARAYSQIYNEKSRHLGVRHSMVRELIRNGVISIEFVQTQHNLADHLTKGLARDLVNKSVNGMGLKSK
nr:zinc finger, CCHC-type [Tanacetum cinerariifolium]